jgi:CubicO group peptidase (beta-lactamase class C family)
MSHSTFSLPMAATWPMSQTHAGPSGKPAAVLRPMGVQAPWPVGGMFSSATDLARFAVMFMNDGKIDGSQVIPAAVVKRMSTPNVAVHSQVAGGRYGYGLVMFTDRGVRLIEHGGTLGGSATDFVMAPDRHVAVIVFANRTSHLTRTVDKALEIALSLPPRGAPPTPMALSEAEASEYVGRYAQGIGSVTEVVRTENGIGLRIGTTPVPLTRIEKDAFMVRFPGFTDPIRLEFVRGADGRVEYLHNRMRALTRMPDGVRSGK